MSRSVKIVFILLIFIFLFYSLPQNAAAKNLSWTRWFRKVQIDGYVYLSRDFKGTLKAKVRTEALEWDNFFDYGVNDCASRAPISNAKISIPGLVKETRTDELGYFKIKTWWAKLRDKKIVIKVRDNIEITTNMPIDTLHAIVIIEITNTNSPRVKILRADEKWPQKRKNVVVMVPGFGIDIFGWRPFGSKSSWTETANLFKRDPKLDRYQFHLFETWDDQSIQDSSMELGSFLHMIRRAYGRRPKIIILANSAGGLITRHYTVSTFFSPGTINRFLMIATPNRGSALSNLHIESSENSSGKCSDGNGMAAAEIRPNSAFLKCLNKDYEYSSSINPSSCYNAYNIVNNKKYRDGINEDIECAIMAGDVYPVIKKEADKGVEILGKFFFNLTGSQAAQNSLQEMFGSMSNNDASRHWDGAVSLESQLIPGIPHITLPYWHGELHRPESIEDERYRFLQNFIVEGNKTFRVRKR